MNSFYETAMTTGELDACVNAVVDHYKRNIFMDIEGLKKQLQTDFKDYDQYQRIERVKVMCSRV